MWDAIDRNPLFWLGLGQNEWIRPVRRRFRSPGDILYSYLPAGTHPSDHHQRSPWSPYGQSKPASIPNVHNYRQNTRISSLIIGIFRIFFLPVRIFSSLETVILALIPAEIHKDGHMAVQAGHEMVIHVRTHTHAQSHTVHTFTYSRTRYTHSRTVAHGTHHTFFYHRKKL